MALPQILNIQGSLCLDMRIPDTTRTGLVGHSRGGYFALRGMLNALDFFKVGYAGAPGDPTKAASINEPDMGLLASNQAGYDAGVMAPLSTTMRMAQALIEADKTSNPMIATRTFGGTSRAVCLLAILVCACGGEGPTAPAMPAKPGDLKSSLSMSFDALTIPANAACSMSISQHGQVLLERGRGQVAPGRPASVDSLYRIASLTKPITASAVLISEQAGRLSRNDKLAQFRAYAEPAPTIDELIKHIPGLSNYTDTPAYLSGKDSPTTLEGLVSLIQPWDGIRRYQYSNSHYVYLGGVLQQVNELRYEEIVQRDIFGPAGMSQSSFAIPPASESAGYPFPSNTHSSWVLYGGGITSTAADLTRFNQALLNNHFGFGAVESFDRSAGVTSFGMGGSVQNGDLRFTHTGGLDSYSSFNVIFPGDRSSVVVLCNFPGNGLPNFVLGPGGIRSIMLGG